MIDHDYEWKLVLERLFEEAIAFFMPELHELIDFSVPPVFLDKEFANLIAERMKDKKKSADKLAKVQLKDGSEKWILIHFEVQSYFETNFAKRVYLYYHLILEKYGDIDLTTFVVYTGAKIPRNYNAYKRSFQGTELYFKFNSYKIREQNEEDLLKSKNPFAIAIRANLYLLKTNQNLDQRYAYKRQLIELSRERGLKWRETQALFRFIRYIVELPLSLAMKFDREVSTTIQKTAMTIPTEQDRVFARDVFEAVFGEKPDVYYRRLWEKEHQQIIEQQRLLQERQTQERQNVIKNLLELNTFTPEQIVELVDSTTIEEVLRLKAAMEK